MSDKDVNSSVFSVEPHMSHSSCATSLNSRIEEIETEPNEDVQPRYIPSQTFLRSSIVMYFDGIEILINGKPDAVLFIERFKPIMEE